MDNIRRVGAALINLALLISIGFGVASAYESFTVGGEDARQKLINGNKRYVDTKLSHPNQTARRRTEIAKGQRPFAAILSCSDSRVPPEIIFDQGLGDLFVIRLAGNVVDDAALGSLEYAVDHLGIRYIMVLGHQRCGAVDATVKGGEIHGHISGIVKAIQPSLEKVKNLPGDVLDNAVRANISMVVHQLKSSGPILKEFVKKGALAIDGAYYDLEDGKVTVLP
jgi:carbonic anhydrase